MAHNMKIYLIGSLRNPGIPGVGQALRAAGFSVFDDWHSAGKFADDTWKQYEQSRGHSYQQALEGKAAQHVFQFDFNHLESSDAAVLVLPAGRSGWMELGFMAGRNKRTFILLDSTVDRWDVMALFADRVVESVPALVEAIRASR